MPRAFPRNLAPCLRLNATSPTRFARNIAVNYGNATAITLEAWTRCSRLLPSSTEAIISTSEDVNGKRGIRWNRNGQNLELIAEGKGAATKTATLTPAQRLIGNVVHVLATFSNTNGIRLYVNGVLAAGPTAATDSTLGTSHLALGVDLASQYYVGLVGGARVWTRELSAAEALAAYNGAAVSSTGLIADLPCTDGAGAIVTDRSGVGNHLTVDSSSALAWYQDGILRSRIPSIIQSPEDLPGLACDLDASRLVGLVNNDPVASFTDFSGVGAHGTAAGAARPTYKTNIQNGLPGVLYDGVANVSDLVGATLGITGAFHVFAVFKTVALSASAGIFGNAVGGHLQINHHGPDVAVYPYRGSSANNVGYAFAGATAGLLNFSWDGTITNPHAMVSRSQGVRQVIKKPADVAASLANYKIGNQTAFWNGYLHQLVVYRRRLQEIEALKMEEYLARKWGF